MLSSMEELEDSSCSGPRHRPIGQQQSSVSEAFNKFTTNTFSKKHSDGLSVSTSTASINQQPRLPTPSGIPRSTSFFSSLNSFATKSMPLVSRNEVAQQPAPVKRWRKISDCLAQTPFFSLNSQYQQRVPTAPITPKTRRQSAVKIKQHGLMQPIHPPLPRSATTDNLGQGQGQQSSPHTTSYMRPTSSSAARNGSIISPKQRKTPMPTMLTIASRDTPSKTPTDQHQQRTPTQKYPVRKDSLPSAQASAGVSSYHKDRVLSTPASAAISSARKDSFHAPPFKSNMKPLSAKAAGKQPMIPDMAVSTSGGQDSGVAFTGDEEVQRRFEENVRRAMVLSRVDDHSHILEYMPALKIEDDNLYEAMRDSDDDNKLCKSKKSATPELRTPQADPSTPRQVFEAMGPIWWLGRYTSLHDRFRTSALHDPPSIPNANDPPSPSPAPSFSSTESLNQPMHNDARRTRRVYIHLRSLCMTDEAKQSLDEFKVIMDARERKITEGGGKLGPKIREKRGFFQGLMGKKKGEGSGK